MLKSNPEKQSALFVATLASFLTPFMGASLNIALPQMGNEFSMDSATLNWVATSYLLAAAIFLVPFGKMADIHGRKKVFLLGIIIYTISSFTTAIAPNVLILLSSRVIQGMGGAMIYSTGIAILTSVFPVSERGKVLGINVAAVYLGLSLGPFLGGLLTEYLGWRSIFWINIPLGLIIITSILLFLKGEWAEAIGERFDLLGSLIYGLGLLLFMYGLSLLPAMNGFILTLLGVIILILFIRREISISYPILDIRLFKHNTVFAFSNLAALINYSATFASGFLLSLYLQYIHSLSPIQAGMILVAQPIMMTVFSPVAGRISDKIEPVIVASIGMALTAIGLCFFIFLKENTSHSYIIMGLIVQGLGFALFSSPNTNAIMSSVEKRFYGVASSTTGTMRLVGQMISMGIVFLIFNFYIGKKSFQADIFPELLVSIKVLFLLFTALCTLGVFASLARGKLNRLP
ncbi:MAG: MFS transporter [Bacteroidales bacterium]|nr:MFS transporter [Bacteroidales bacterium]